MSVKVSGGGSGDYLTVEHPVLWSEERRRIEERKIADESRKVAGLRRERQRRDSLIEQREVGNGTGSRSSKGSDRV